MSTSHLSRAWLLLAAAMCFSCLNPHETVEAAETLVQGDETDLTDERRPIRGTTRMILFCFDGVGHEALVEAMGSGDMPKLAEALGLQDDGSFAHAFAHPKVLSILPSTTVASWSAIFTGQGPAHTGITGNEQLVRDGEDGPVFFAPAPVTVTDMSQVMDTVNDGAVGGYVQVPTFYEQADLRAHVSLAHLHRGADIFTLPGGADLAQVFAVFLAGTFDGDDETGAMAVYRELDEESIDSVLEEVGDAGIPDIQTLYFPGVDLFTHVADPALDEQKRYLKEVLDAQIGRVLDTWREAGALEDTYLVFTADHGHTPVLQDDRHSLAVDEDDEPTALIESLGFRLRDYDVGEDDDPTFQAAVAYQGAFAYVYLADRSKCPEEDDECDWRAAARLDEERFVRGASTRNGASFPRTFRLDDRDAPKVNTN